MICSIKVENYKIKEKLIQLFKSNEKNLKKKNKNLIKITSNLNLIKNIYYKLKHKKKIVHKLDLKMLKNLSEQIKTKTYKWNNVKFLKHKKILTLKDRIIQRLIEIILNTIYEPIFETLEYNYGFRHKKNIPMMIQKLKLQHQKWTCALKSQITENNEKIHYKTLTKILKKKIEDPIFLQLVQNLLKNKSTSFILYNICVHEFDLYISKKIKNLKNKETWLYFSDFKFYHKFILEGSTVRQKKPLKKEKTDRFNIKMFQKARNSLKKNKKEKIHFKIRDKRKKSFEIVYSRYNNNWVMFTNYNYNKIEKWKHKLMRWFKKNLKINLKKILVINLFRTKLNYLGFTFYIISSKIKKFCYKNKIKARRKKQKVLFIGMDNQYLKSKLVQKQILTVKYKPNHVNAYYNLKPIQIWVKFRQKLKILVHYYYNTITHLSDLNYYHYIYKFSLLKTIAHKIKKSITYVSTNYLGHLKAQKDIKNQQNFNIKNLP